MATYTPQDADGVIISNTKDTKVTLDSEVVHAVVDSGTITTVTAVTGITNAVTVNSHAVTNAGTFAVQAAAQPGVDIGDVTINNSTLASAVNIQDGGNTITVDGAVTVSGTATVSQATGTNLHAVVDSGAIQITDGVSAAIKATVLDLASGNPISVVIAHPGTGVPFGGVILIGADTSTMASIIDGGSGGQVLTVASGSAPHAGTDSSLYPVHDAPVKIGGKAASSAPTAVTAAQRVNAYFDLNGRLIVHDDQAIPAGTNAIGKLAANSGVDIGDVDVLSLPAIPTGTNTIGNVGAVSIATGGATSVHLVSAGSGDATNVKASAGKLLGWYISNTNAAARYIKFHNTASAPTPGSGVVMSFMIPAGGAANLGFGEGIDFATGIAFSLVTGAADADTTGVAASEMIVNLWFK